MTTEVIARHIDDRGGGLARVDGRVRLVEGLALPNDEIELRLSYYNSATYWVDIDQLLTVFGLTRSDLEDTEKVNESVRRLAARMPTYITLKDVKKAMGQGPGRCLPRNAIREAMGRHDRPARAEMPLRGSAQNAGAAAQGGGPTGRLAARRLGGVRGRVVRVGHALACPLSP